MDFMVCVTIDVPGASREELEDLAIHVLEALDGDEAAHVRGVVCGGNFDPPQLDITMTVEAESVEDLAARLARF